MDTAEELFEPTDAEVLVMTGISLLFLIFVVWPIAMIAYLSSHNPWRSPRVGKMISRFWRWLECPAPDQAQQLEDPSSLSNRVVAGVAIVTILATIASLTGLWWFSPK